MCWRLSDLIQSFPATENFVSSSTAKREIQQHVAPRHGKKRFSFFLQRLIHQAYVWDSYERNIAQLYTKKLPCLTKNEKLCFAAHSTIEDLIKSELDRFQWIIVTTGLAIFGQVFNDDMLKCRQRRNINRSWISEFTQSRQLRIQAFRPAKSYCWEISCHEDCRLSHKTAMR